MSVLESVKGIRFHFKWSELTSYTSATKLLYAIYQL